MGEHFSVTKRCELSFDACQSASLDCAEADMRKNSDSHPIHEPPAMEAQSLCLRGSSSPAHQINSNTVQTSSLQLEPESHEPDKAFRDSQACCSNPGVAVEEEKSPEQGLASGKGYDQHCIITESHSPVQSPVHGEWKSIGERSPERSPSCSLESAGNRLDVNQSREPRDTCEVKESNSEGSLQQDIAVCEEKSHGSTLSCIASGPDMTLKPTPDVAQADQVRNLPKGHGIAVSGNQPNASPASRSTEIQEAPVDEELVNKASGAEIPSKGVRGRAEVNDIGTLDSLKVFPEAMDDDLPGVEEDGPMAISQRKELSASRSVRQSSANNDTDTPDIAMHKSEQLAVKLAAAVADEQLANNYYAGLDDDGIDDVRVSELSLNPAPGTDVAVDKPGKGKEIHATSRIIATTNYTAEPQKADLSGKIQLQSCDPDPANAKAADIGYLSHAATKQAQTSMEVAADDNEVTIAKEKDNDPSIYSKHQSSVVASPDQREEGWCQG